jgi:two-component system nitrate/nitrite response regulator NarL
VKPGFVVAVMSSKTVVNPKSQAIRVLVADDDPLVRSAVTTLLTQDPDLQVVGEADDGQKTVELVRRLHPDVLLLDLNMPQKAGLEALRDLGDQPQMKCLVLTVSIAKLQVLEALQLGARGIVMKSNAARYLPKAIDAVRHNQYWIDDRPVPGVNHIIRELQSQIKPAPAENPKRLLLNERELNIVTYIVEGRTNKDIAATIATSEQVVKNHLGKIFDKLGVFNRLELALYALDNNLVERRATGT